MRHKNIVICFIALLTIVIPLMLHEGYFNRFSSGAVAKLQSMGATVIRDEAQESRPVIAILFQGRCMPGATLKRFEDWHIRYLIPFKDSLTKLEIEYNAMITDDGMMALCDFNRLETLIEPRSKPQNH